MKTFPIIRAFPATATAKKAVVVNENRKSVCIYNNEEANIVEVVSSKESVYGQGIPIRPKGNYENLHYCQGAYYLICDTGLTADCRIEEQILKV